MTMTVQNIQRKYRVDYATAERLRPVFVRLGDIHLMARRVLARPEKATKYLGYIVQWCEELGVEPASVLRGEAVETPARSKPATCEHRWAADVKRRRWDCIHCGSWIDGDNLRFDSDTVVVQPPSGETPVRSEPLCICGHARTAHATHTLGLRCYHLRCYCMNYTPITETPAP